MNQEVTLTRPRATTPRAAAITGILFSLLLLTSLTLIRLSVPEDPQEAGTWLSGGWKTISIASICCRSPALPSCGSSA